jgi:hypothetical protein
MKNAGKHVVVLENNHFVEPKSAMKSTGIQLTSIGSNKLDWY